MSSTPRLPHPTKEDDVSTHEASSDGPLSPKASRKQVHSRSSSGDVGSASKLKRSQSKGALSDFHGKKNTKGKLGRESSEEELSDKVGLDLVRLNSAAEPHLRRVELGSFELRGDLS